ncbi:MAG: MarR family transcriptional regulator [Chloroflexi bacterium]|nr:MarR family transcriptional regulator [Chloroflexota bacterium]
MMKHHRLHYKEVLHDLLAEQGVSDIQGVEIMRLVRMISVAYETILSARMREKGLSGPRWRLLLHLYMAERMGLSPLSPTQLSKLQHVSKNTISSLLRSLEEQGLVVREINPLDRRQIHLRLTDAAREHIRQVTPQHVRLLNELAAGLTDDEREQLIHLLQKLRQSMKHYQQEC